MRVISALAGLSALGFCAARIALANESPELTSASTALPDDASQSARSGAILEEIVVTARKRAENLQNVPDSITAFTATTIEMRVSNTSVISSRSPPT